MSRHNTGNPIGSDSPLDLQDNAKNFDIYSNSEQASFPNRFGDPQLTIAENNRRALLQIDRAEAAADDAVAAAGAIGPIKFYDTLAQAQADIGNIPDDGVVEVSVDESRDGARTRYKKSVSGLEFVVNLDRLRIELATPTGNDVVGGIDSHNKLREYNGGASLVKMILRGEVLCYYKHDPLDDSSTDNKNNIIVGQDGRRWKLQTQQPNVLYTAHAEGETPFDRFKNTLLALKDNGVLIDASKETIIFSEPIVKTGVNRISLIGRGSKWRCADGIRYRSMTEFIGCSGVSARGFDFDTNMQGLPAFTAGDYAGGPKCMAMHFDGCQDTSVKYNTSKNLYTRVIGAYNCGGFFKVSQNVFTSPQQNQDQILEFVHLQTCTGDIDIEKNGFISAMPSSAGKAPAAVFGSGLVNGRVNVSDNTTYWCGRNNDGAHRLSAFDFYYNVDNLTFERNKSFDSLSGSLRVNSTTNAEIHGNYAELAEMGESGSYVYLFSAASSLFSKIDNLNASRNTLIDKTGRAEYAIGLVSNDWGCIIGNVSIWENTIRGFKKSLYGQGPMHDIRYYKNDVIGGQGEIQITLNAPINSVHGSEEGAYVQRVLIEGNEIRKGGAIGSAVTLDLIRTPSPFSGSLGLIEIVDNDFSSVSENTSACVNANVQSGRGAVVSVKRNKAKNFNYDWYVRGALRATVADNDSESTGTAHILQSGNTLFEQYGNRIANGPIRGVVKLASGTATVYTPEVLSSSVIRLSRLTLSGAPGEIYKGVIVNKTSFVINSSSATDSAEVLWEVIN